MSTPDLSPIPREARPFQGEPAGVVTRVVANTIDALVVLAALGLGYLGWCSLIFLLDPRGFHFPEISFLFTLTAGMTVSVIYLWLAWWLLGRTYGSHVMGVRVAGRRGHKLGPLRSLARAAFCVFFPIGLFWCVVSRDRRSVQDIVLWTAVVYDWMPRVVGQHEPDEPVSPPAGR